MTTNLDFLKKFTSNDLDNVVKYVNMYLRMAPDAIEKMKNDLSEKRWAKLSDNAHSFKSMAHYMGMKEAVRLLEQIEEQARNQVEVNELGDHLNRVEELTQSSYAELNDFLKASA